MITIYSYEYDNFVLAEYGGRQRTIYQSLMKEGVVMSCREEYQDAAQYKDYCDNTSYFHLLCIKKNACSNFF